MRSEEGFVHFAHTFCIWSRKFGIKTKCWQRKALHRSADSTALRYLNQTTRYFRLSRWSQCQMKQRTVASVFAVSRLGNRSHYKYDTDQFLFSTLLRFIGHRNWKDAKRFKTPSKKRKEKTIINRLALCDPSGLLLWQEKRRKKMFTYQSEQSVILLVNSLQRDLCSRTSKTICQNLRTSLTISGLCCVDVTNVRAPELVVVFCFFCYL